MSTAAASTICVRINGEPRTIPAGLNVAGLLSYLDVALRGVAVEKNRAIVPKATYEQTPVEANDEIEIVSFIGGG